MKRPRLAITVAVATGLIVLYEFAFGRPISVPTAAIDRIGLHASSTGGEGVDREITDPTRIAAAVAFLRAHDRGGWGGTWDTFPTPKYTAKFHSGGQMQYVVWVGHEGTTWIGFRAGGQGGQESLLRTVSSAERDELIRLLGF